MQAEEKPPWPGPGELGDKVASVEDLARSQATYWSTAPAAGFPMRAVHHCLLARPAFWYVLNVAVLNSLSISVHLLSWSEGASPFLALKRTKPKKNTRILSYPASHTSQAVIVIVYAKAL